MSAGHTGRTDGGEACRLAHRERLPDSAGDLGSADAGHQVVPVGQEDPWRLDGNATTRQDGLGCESWPSWRPGTSYPDE